MTERLNALSGIGGVRTQRGRCLCSACRRSVLMPCRALEAFGRAGAGCGSWPAGLCLNALSGIGGVRTLAIWRPRGGGEPEVLMPCRALEAFGPTQADPTQADRRRS